MLSCFKGTETERILIYPLLEDKELGLRKILSNKYFVMFLLVCSPRFTVLSKGGEDGLFLRNKGAKFCHNT